jgi:hypothetical protein
MMRMGMKRDGIRKNLKNIGLREEAWKGEVGKGNLK